MSTTSQGEGWWQASDGNWYPPDAGGAAAVQPVPGPAPAAGYFVPTTPCLRCGQPTVLDRVSCEHCGQVKMLPLGVTLTTPGRRLGQYSLDLLLSIVTLGLGWFIWSLFIWRRGETPAMQIMRIKVVMKDTGQPATWGPMALREIVGKGIIMGAIAAVTAYIAWIILAFMLMWDKDRQELWDKIASTIVVSGYPEPVEFGQPFDAQPIEAPVPTEPAPAPVAAEPPQA
ncbi:MAG TPA: RDD family protein [Acidimicrobiales bacterium]